jgi:hypothetical protein
MPLCPAGSLVWASDPARPAGFNSATWAELDPAQKKMSKIVGFLVYLFYGFVLYIYIYISEKKQKNILLCVAYSLYPNIVLERSFFYIKKTNIPSLKENVF